MSLPSAKRPGRGLILLLPSSTEIKERVELYPSEPSWPVRRRNRSFSTDPLYRYVQLYDVWCTFDAGLQHVSITDVLYCHHQEKDRISTPEINPGRFECALVQKQDHWNGSRAEETKHIPWIRRSHAKLTSGLRWLLSFLFCWRQTARVSKQQDPPPPPCGLFIRCLSGCIRWSQFWTFL
jgi:hypothetical protein